MCVDCFDRMYYIELPSKKVYPMDRSISNTIFGYQNLLMGQTNFHFTQLQLISNGQFPFVESCCTFLFTHLPDTIYTHNNIH
jgi:hypothetical protein